MVAGIIFIVIGGGYLYFQLMGSSDILSTDRDKQLKTCEGLSEESCFANEVCQGSYGPSFCSGGPSVSCTADLVFQSCRPSGLTPSEVSRISDECSKVGGELRKDRIGGCKCLCEKPNYIGKDRCLRDLIYSLESS